MNLIISRRSKRHWLPAYLKPINTLPTPRTGSSMAVGQTLSLPPRNKRERVGYARLHRTGLEKRSSKNTWKLCSIVLSVGEGRVEYKLHVEQPRTVAGVTSNSPGRLVWKRSSPTQTRSISSSLRTSQSNSLCSEKMVIQFKLVEDAHSEVTIMPLEDLNLQHQKNLTRKMMSVSYC